MRERRRASTATRDLVGQGCPSAMTEKEVMTSKTFRSLLLLGVSLFPSLAQAKVVKYVGTDAVGNVRVIEDAQGNVIERHDYLPFGEECTAGPCAANPGVGAGQPRKFTGKERDAETGLDYFGA